MLSASVGKPRWPCITLGICRYLSFFHHQSSSRKCQLEFQRALCDKQLSFHPEKTLSLPHASAREEERCDGSSRAAQSKICLLVASAQASLGNPVFIVLKRRIGLVD